MKFLFKDKFIRNSAILFTATMIGNIAGYLFQISMGRQLKIEEYGELNALLSIMVVFGIPLITIVNFITREVAVYKSNSDYRSIKSLYNLIKKKLSKFIIPLSLIFLFTDHFLSEFLNVKIEYLLIINLLIFANILLTINTGFIQGMQCFFQLSLMTLGPSVLKLIFSIILVGIGFGILGSLGGILLGIIIIICYSKYIINLKLPKKLNNFKYSINNSYHYLVGLLIANFFFGVLTQSDLILVKHYYTSHEAGLYASASVIGKAVMYLPSAISMTLFPMVTENQVNGNSSKTLLIKSLIITLILSGGGSLLLFLFPNFIIGAFFGEKYLEAAFLTRNFGIAMLPSALIFILLNYSLAQERFGITYCLIVSVIIQLIGIHFYRNNLNNVLYVIMTAGSISLFLSILLIFDSLILRKIRRV